MLLADEMEVIGTGIEDVNQQVFAEYFVKEFGESYEAKGLTFSEALKAKRVLRGDSLSLAGLLFFGKRPQDIKPAYTVKVVSFFGNDLASNAYRSKPADLQGTIPELFTQTMQFLKANLHHVQAGQGELFKVVIPRLVLTPFLLLLYI